MSQSKTQGQSKKQGKRGPTRYVALYMSKRQWETICEALHAGRCLGIENLFGTHRAVTKVKGKPANRKRRAHHALKRIEAAENIAHVKAEVVDVLPAL